MKILSLVLSLMWAVSAQAQVTLPKPVPTKPIPNCVVPKIDGDKVPFPLRNANTKFELAENETYLLNGFLYQKEGKYYFKVDFETQPWLMTAKRAQFPYFLINPEDADMVKNSGSDMVQMAVVARKNDVSTGSQEWSNNLKLNLITTPVRFTDQQ